MRIANRGPAAGVTGVESLTDILRTEWNKVNEMINRFEEDFGTDSENAPGLNGILGPHQRYCERIRRKLEEFLSPQEAREAATQICNLALDIDAEIGRILKDPLVRKLYDYDGLFFTARGARLFHRTFDGLHLLRWLDDFALETFFHGREKHFAVRRMLEELGRHNEVARIRRMNWEESGTLGMLPPEVLEAILQEALAPASEADPAPPLLSPEEEVFFGSFEKQMERQDRYR